MQIRLIAEGEYDYILRHEREGWLDKRLSTLQEELEEIEPDKLDDIEIKNEEIKTFQKFADETKEKLAKHGPTVFRICSIKEKDVIIAASKHNIPITDRKNAGTNVMSGILAHGEIQKLTAFDMGFRGFSNLHGMDGEEIPNDKKFMSQVKRSLPKEYKVELGSQIMGDISEDEEKN